MRGCVGSRRPRAAFHCLAAVLTLLALAPPAGATFASGGWFEAPGISLAHLAEGESFESLDGAFTFSGFQVGVSGFAPRSLRFYRVIRLEDGFKLVAPMGALFGSHGELHLSYEVMANEQAGQEFLVEAMSMSILGISVGSGAELKAIADLFDPNNVGRSLLEVPPLRAEVHGLFGHGHGSGGESPLVTPLLQQVLVKEVVTASSGSNDKHRHKWGGLAAGALVTHRFAAVVPEPATALMLGGGLLGLATLGKRRRSRRRLSE